MNNQKFRAWDKKRGEWYGESNPNCLTFKGFSIFGECTLMCQPRMEDLKHLEIEQFTGLHDKDGNEIYKGDMLSDGNINLEVYYKTVNGSFAAKGAVHHIFPHRFKHFKVVGNVHENPELLK